MTAKQNPWLKKKKIEVKLEELPEDINEKVNAFCLGCNLKKLK